MSDQRRGGVIQMQVDGVQYDTKGEATYNLGHVKRTAILGSDGKVHGFKEEAQAPFIEVKLTDRGSLNLANVVDLTDSTVALSLANGKVVTLRSAWYAGEGTGHTDEGELDFRMEGKSAQEISA